MEMLEGRILFSITCSNKGDKEMACLVRVRSGEVNNSIQWAKLKTIKTSGMYHLTVTTGYYRIDEGHTANS